MLGKLVLRLMARDAGRDRSHLSAGALARAPVSRLLCFLRDDLAGCDLRRVREQGGYILPYPVRSSSIGFLGSGLVLEDAG